MKTNNIIISMIEERIMTNVLNKSISLIEEMKSNLARKALTAKENELKEEYTEQFLYLTNLTNDFLLHNTAKLNDEDINKLYNMGLDIYHLVNNQVKKAFPTELKLPKDIK